MTGLKNPIGDRHGEPASVWRENELAVVILLRVLARFTGHPRSTDLLIQATFKIAIFVKNQELSSSISRQGLYRVIAALYC